MSDAPVLDGVNLVEDYDATEDFIKKHTPYIESCGSGEQAAVCITVGHEIPHPNDSSHFIDWIELQADGTPIARFDLSPVATMPRVSVQVAVAPGTVLRALEHCNLDGVFAYEVTV